jgi:hypothetical protein
MLFIFQGAFTIGFQATVWVYRDPSSPSPTERFFHLHRYKLDHELPDRLHHSSCPRKHQMEDLHHLCCLECNMGSHYGKSFSRLYTLITNANDLPQYLFYPGKSLLQL